jgi:hypothetical protein
MSAYVEPTRPKPWGAIYTIPDPQEPDMTTADVRRYIAELPDEYLFGAVKRFRDEACLGRDRLAVGVIAAEDGADFWTGDVTTGGANGYFVRSYISEYLIARKAGQNPLDGSVAGFEAAKAAYQRAVGIVPPPPPPGELRGPISVAGRDFEVPA